jgi:hypothetical protein
MKTNTSNIINIKNTEKFKKIPKQYCRNINVNYLRLKEILFEDEHILYFLIVVISLFTLGFIFSIHQKNQKNKQTLTTTLSHPINKISTNENNILPHEKSSNNHMVDSNNLNNQSKYFQANLDTSATTHPSYSLTVHEVNQLKRLLLSQPSHQHDSGLLYSPALPIVNKTPEIPVIKSHSLQSCFYKGEMYLPGDIVKTNAGWIRCTPILSLSQNDPEKQKSGNPNPVWTKVQ